MLGETGVVCGERDREVRFGELGVGLGNRFDELQGRLLVGLVREEPVELQEGFAQRLGRGGRLRQHPLEFRLEVVADARAVEALAAGAARERRDHLLRPRRRRVEFAPQACRFERQRPGARSNGDFGRAPGERRVTRLARGLEKGAGRERGLAALQGDVAEEQAVHEFGREAPFWLSRRRRIRGRRSSGSVRIGGGLCLGGGGLCLGRGWLCLGGGWLSLGGGRLVLGEDGQDRPREDARNSGECKATKLSQDGLSCVGRRLFCVGSRFRRGRMTDECRVYLAAQQTSA